MKRKRFTEERIVGVLREHEAGGRTREICRRQGISEQIPLEVEIWRDGGSGQPSSA